MPGASLARFDEIGEMPAAFLDDGVHGAASTGTALVAASR